MHSQLPTEIDPFRFAHHGLKLHGQIHISSMQRLAELVQDDGGLVNVDMQFDVDETGTPFMHGQFSCEVTLLCERCMEPLKLNLELNALLGMVRHERKVEGLAEQYDPWILDDAKQVDPVQVVEDEIILALPLVPKHDFSCLPEELWQSGEEKSEVDKPASPFAVLAALKSKK